MDDDWHDFDSAVWRWIVKLTGHEELADAAVAALVSGLDTPSLVRLAGMDSAAWSEFPPVLTSLFEERGLTLPSHADAVKGIADDLLNEIAAGDLEIRPGTHELYRLCANLMDQPAFRDLGVFVGLDDAFYLADQGIYGTPDDVATDALNAVHELIARGGVRRV